MSELSQGERGELLRHLKIKWASLNDAFQRQPLSTDTEQKKHRKEELARSLAEVRFLGSQPMYTAVGLPTGGPSGCKD